MNKSLMTFELEKEFLKQGDYGNAFIQAGIMYKESFGFEFELG
jgi:hypothetical protein